MPIPQTTRSSIGPSVARNTYGNAPRTLGGIFNAPTTFTSFGSILSADQTFPNNSTQTLGTVNLPAYTFSKGSVTRISFAGELTWNLVPGGFAFLRLQVTPNSAGLPYNIQIAPGAASPGGVGSYIFGGVITLFAPEDPSATGNVSISSLVYDIQSPVVPSTPVFGLPQGSSLGNLSLDTTGLSSGIDFNLQMNLTGGTSIGFTKLLYFLTEMVGG